MLGTLQVLIHLILITTYEVGISIMLILQKRKFK